jgi:hypothetical protein
MICFAKPGLTDYLYVMQSVKILVTWYMCDMLIRHRPFLFIRDKSNISSDRMLHKGYDHNGSVSNKKRKEIHVVVILKGLGAKTN